MAKIRTVLWDVGGVLLTNGWDHGGRESLFQKFGIDREAFEERHPEANDAWERGLISIDEYLDRTLFYQPRSFTRDAFIAGMKAESQWLPNTAFRILQGLAASEKVVQGMLNNEARELNDYRIVTFGLRDFFQGFLSSCYIGMRKPETKMFRFAGDVFQTAPEETVFIDDRQGNVAAAAEVGMHAVHYTGPEQLEARLKQLGVCLS
jgi:putative hydrolase of the HAD superfamily